MADSALKRLAQMGKPGQWLIAALEGAQYSAEPGRHDPGWFHPSSFGNECDAYLAFKFLGAPELEIIEAKTQRIYDYGNDRDLQLKNYMAKAGVSIITDERQRHVEIPHLRIRGDLDDLVQNQITLHKFVIDYKTMRSGLWKDLESVMHSHHLQVHPYMFAKEVYRAFVIYENKDTQELKAMVADFNNKIWQEEIVNRITRITQGLEQDLVYRTPVHCSRCPFSANGVCTGNDIASLKRRSKLWQ